MNPADASAGALHIRTTSDAAELAPVRKQIEAFCTSAGFDERSTQEIGLCVNEAMANIIRHAYRDRAGEPIELTATFMQNMLHLSLRDWGTGLQPGPLPRHKNDPMNPGGLGLICLGRLMDKVTFTPQNPGMLLEMFRKRADTTNESFTN
jgi:anti-sigma regulatory factor (Ser/Thr protein kinase)